MSVLDAAPARPSIAATTTDRRTDDRHHLLAAPVIDALLAAGIGTGVAAVGSGPGGPLVPLALAVAWPATVAACSGYQRRFFGPGRREARRIGHAGLWLTALLAVFGAVTAAGSVRPLIVGGMPVLTVLSLAARLGLRWRIQAAWRAGKRLRRVVLVGPAAAVDTVVDQLRRRGGHGLVIAGACLSRRGGSRHEPSRPSSAPVLGDVDDVVEAARAVGAHTVIVLASTLPAATLRTLAWQLHEDDVDVVMAPTVVDVPGPRVSLHPVAGLPMLHVEPPVLDGLRRVLKGVFDRVVAAVALALLLPVLVAIGVAVRMTSTGPALFRQRRVGHRGAEFTMIKFRTMEDGADRRRDELAHLNDRAEGLLFKMRNDPRVTPVGRWLRRYSLDELPQLVNVVAGHMSLVGPRPPLPSEVAGYDEQARRRLLVKPGLTGLWQISGRSDLPWDESIRLDLQYIENWSLGLDLSILARTTTPVLRGTGAY